MQRTTTPTATTPPLSRPPTREGRKPSLSGPATRRRASSAAAPVTDAAAPPALPDYALPAAARVRRDAADGPPPAAAGAVRSPDAAAGRSTTTPAFVPPPLPTATSASSASWQPSEATLMHQQMTELATKRISTLDYLRKAHEGRVYWFNTYLFDRPDLARMPSLDPRRVARRATNLLLLGLSVPTISDLYASSALEFVRCLNALLAEFDSFQQLHGDASSASSAALARARLPNILLRLPGGKARSASAADFGSDDAPASAPGAGPQQQPAPQQQSSSSAVMAFAAAESDLLPGEEYTYLLTPSLPFEPDLYETFATLCDVLIDCYARFLALVPTPRECSGAVADLFAKADAKLRKMIVQGVVKEFEDHSRSHVKSEVASIGKVVLAGLM